MLYNHLPLFAVTYEHRNSPPTALVSSSLFTASLFEPSRRLRLQPFPLRYPYTPAYSPIHSFSLFATYHQQSALLFVCITYIQNPYNARATQQGEALSKPKSHQMS
jgi:hypothetical protein